MAGITDGCGRMIDYARISVTDRCNYRCKYCMPEEGVPRLGHVDVMRYEDILFLCEVLAGLGVKKIRFTGGEPLVRKGMVPFLIHFREIFPQMAISITTNASLLSRYARELADVSLSGMNISLDTVDPEKFREITRTGDIRDVFDGIAAAQSAGIRNIKTNTVLIRGFNDNEISEILDYAWRHRITPRFIEFMPLGDDVWEKRKFIGASEILDIIARTGVWRQRVSIKTLVPHGPAKYYENVDNGQIVGVIEAVSAHFCNACNRLRITATGNLRACLFSPAETPLLSLIRERNVNALQNEILNGMNQKPVYWEDLRDGKQRMSSIGG